MAKVRSVVWQASVHSIRERRIITSMQVFIYHFQDICISSTYLTQLLRLYLSIFTSPLNITCTSYLYKSLATVACTIVLYLSLLHVACTWFSYICTLDRKSINIWTMLRSQSHEGRCQCSSIHISLLENFPKLNNFEQYFKNLRWFEV